ncbi:aminopeptidase P N-terminal domain-containing protein [Pedobacter boryungensis]|uniref:Xaa-Pro aminopeptidase n=1 Tax=Pedobacter boryungensis TaxID=869962 RepID=A0ABX2DB67_9SPHI|nr:aminopeptidase P N-terminal domain-containing protein [Pedobacter boryungensis]NQX31303.1 aminopeptidase P N-terminal domain-containing protein [Pedobacter boryungensis]
MIRKLLTVLFLALVMQTSFAQDFEPTDYFSKDFHAQRREALRKIMPDSSVMVVFAYPTRTFSNDVDYLYHQNPDLYYFSGYKEPDAVLFIFKESQKDDKGNAYKELFFVQKRSPQQESWTGRRLGVEGVKEKLGIPMVFNGNDFKDYAINLAKFKNIIYSMPPSMAPSKTESPLLAGLVNSFVKKANISLDNLSDVSTARRLYNKLTGQLREIKTPEELVMLRKAVEISCHAHSEVMKAANTNMSELEIQGIQEFVHKKYGAEEVGYGSIVGAGENGCILHYETNTKTKVGNSLVLMDVGAEYHGYSADVTRTIPANGKFTESEKQIYQIVYDAQEAAFKTLKDGSTFSAASNAANEVISEGLLKLGIIKDKKDYRKYYTHGLSHHIGLDVHDRSSSGTLLANMVITIEPGIYIPANSDCDKKWWSIGVRIEDDVLITKDGYENLSIFAPRSIADIEKKMAGKSAFNDLVLPSLKSGK